MMENKRKKTGKAGSDTDRAIAKPGSSKPKELKTDEPLAEKDEVKQAEENLRRRLK